MATAFAALEPGSRAQTGGSCPAAGPSVVASGLDEPTHLTLDGDSMYFMEFRGLFRVDKAGGVPEPLGRPVISDVFFYGGPQAFDIAVNASRLYVSRQGHLDPSSIGSVVFVFDKAGRFLYEVGASLTQVPNDCHVPFVKEIAIGPGGDLFWIQDDLPQPLRVCEPGPQSGIVWLPTGSVKPVLVWRTEGLGHFLRADATHLFWVDPFGVERSEAAGGVLGAAEMDSSFGIADMNIDANNIYWSTPSDATGSPATYRVSAPGASTKIFDNVLTEIVTDGTFIYGDAPRQGAGAPFNVYRMRPNGHGLYNLAKGGGSSLAVDDTYLYYVDASRQAIFRTCKRAGL